ncbi:putative nuclease HARBI1 [Aphis gossypii]|uniref:putative nuclease HARBI1 n=1 Tax=Aphis gossypii TaxID=80765 RepID=UPI002158C3C8|nr:putative nuclease HARBI1 [Aphis gossypii]
MDEFYIAALENLERQENALNYRQFHHEESNLASVSQPSVSRAIDEVVNAMNQPEIFEYWVKYPSTLTELRQTREKFNAKFNFPGIVGIIDCTHVGIFPPKKDDPDHPEYIYVNRKNYHSINVQLVCDSDMKIINVSALYPGSVNDAYIWNNSLLEPTLREIYNRYPEGFYLLGDSGYPLRPWLMTPLMQFQPNSPEERYNKKFKYVRCLIERCIGLLKMRFRCLLKHRILHYSPVKACKIVNACTILHNICIENNIPFQQDDEIHYIEEIDLGIFEAIDNERENRQGLNEELLAGRRMQRRVIRYFHRN